MLEATQKHVTGKFASDIGQTSSSQPLFSQPTNQPGRLLLNVGHDSRMVVNLVPVI